MNIPAKSIFQHARNCSNCKHKFQFRCPSKTVCFIHDVEIPDENGMVCDYHAKQAWVYSAVNLNQTIEV